MAIDGFHSDAIFSLQEVFLYDKLTLDHAWWVFLVILY